MRTEAILITGAAGEMGQALIEHLSERGTANILALDVNPVPEEIASRCLQAITGDILDEKLMARLVSEYAIPQIYHLAALLSKRSEFTPEAAHRVNVDGTLRLLQLAVEQASWIGQSVKFVFPSSIAVYGLPDLETKGRSGAIKEFEWNMPITMYGCNKLYSEHLGRYYAHHYRQLAADARPHSVDFRAIRFPGLISAFTLPTGGTSDYGPEMLHQAARHEPYICFVRQDTRMPFMVMPDAIKALVTIESAPSDRLSSHVYNVTSFNPSADEMLSLIKKAFPSAQVTFEPDARRQKIVDSWPLDLDDCRAHHDWGWEPDYNQARAFEEYLIPNIKQRYAVRP
jgi:threonine 3-dehydrogenase